MSYRVVVSPRAVEEIEAYACYLSEVSGHVSVAERWVESVYDTLESLREMPDRYELAAENAWFEFTVRRILIGRYVAAYTVDHDTRVVRVLGFRHGARLPQESDFSD